MGHTSSQHIFKTWNYAICTLIENSFALLYIYAGSQELSEKFVDLLNKYFRT